MIYFYNFTGVTAVFIVSNVCGQSSPFSQNDKTLITVSLPGGEEAENYAHRELCTSGGHCGGRVSRSLSAGT